MGFPRWRELGEIEALLQHFSNKKIEPLWKGAETGVKLQEVVNARRIFTTFILGTALLNFGARTDSFGHGQLDLHGKIFPMVCPERHP